VEDIPQMPPIQNRDLGEFIRKTRQDKGLGLRPLAKLAGLDWSYIGRLEKGEIGTPDPVKLQKLARALEVEIEDFYALAGYFMPEGLPELAPYLRVKYDLSEDASEQVERYVARLKKGGQATPRPNRSSRRKP
jgi:transcriptional regulator with XRE-family HTH domain